MPRITGLLVLLLCLGSAAFSEEEMSTPTIQLTLNASQYAADASAAAGCEFAKGRLSKLRQVKDRGSFFVDDAIYNFYDSTKFYPPKWIPTAGDGVFVYYTKMDKAPFTRRVTKVVKK